MSLVYIDPFDDLSSFALTGSPTIVTTGRTGNCMNIPSSTAWATLNLTNLGVGVPSEYLTMGVAVLFPTLGMSVPQEFLRPGLVSFTNILQLMVGSNGRIDACKYNQSIMGSTPTGVVTANQWAYLEVQVRVHDTLGSYLVRVNGVTHINLTNVDTLYTGSNILDQIEFKSPAGVSNTRWDDLYVSTGGTPDVLYGDSAVNTLLPTGNGDVSQWNGSDGDSTNNYQLVDEVPPSGSDFVYSATVGNQDLYVMSDVAAGTIHAVCPVAYAARDEAGARTIKPLLKRTTTSVGTAKTLDFTYTPKQWIYTTDPETGLAWTASNVNALQAGVEVA